MRFQRQASDRLRILCSAALSFGMVTTARAVGPSFEAYFPLSQYPALSDVQPEPTEPNPKSGLVGEIKTLSSEISKSVKEVAQKRNLTCFGDPCLVQVFPLMYSKPDSGFFGGFRAKLTNISRQNPFLYVVNTQIIRSDTAQWLASLNVDVPHINLPIVKPRLKLRSSYARSTEFRYTGEGRDSFDLSHRPDEDKRYSINETAFGGTLLLPLKVYSDKHEFGLYGTYDYSRARNNPFQSEVSSILFTQRPESYRGGTYSAVGAGIFVDTRPTETFTRSGGLLEVGVRMGVLADPRTFSYRFTVIDRRYQSIRRWTLAHRFTMDGIIQDAPFWERAGVGGIDPIRDISGSGILKAYTGGRFHENFKFIESLELRLHQNEFRLMGLRGDLALMPVAFDGGIMSQLFAWSVASGLDVVWNRSFFTRFYVALAEKEWAMRLRFSQEF